MAKLFIIGIGGTGARVIKSLTFLLASGVEINATKVIPIIVDVDLTNGDFIRTIEVLKNYQRIRERLGTEFKHNKFFKTAIETLPQLDSFKFSLNEIGGHKTFKDFIDYRSLDSANKCLIDAFFSEKNLETTLEKGFKGNPNMGSVALNQFESSEGFRHLASNFQEGDRIFIISSLFGGTGAAGLPLLIKNIRGAEANIPNHDRLNKAKVGTLAILPYFGVMPDANSDIDKGTFISKTKAALAYYKDNINSDINALYYIGDQNIKDYPNNDGGREQENNTHFVELASALAIVNFMTIEDQDLNKETIYKEFGIKNNPVEAINFTHLGLDTEKIIKNQLTQYKFFTLFLQQRLLKAIIENQDFCVKGKIKLDNSFLDKPFYRDYITKFNERLNDWLDELADNTVSFTPFKQVSEKNIFQLLNGIAPNKRLFGIGKDNYDLFIDCLNEVEKQVSDYPVEEKFISMFYLATDKMISKKFGV